MKLEHVERGNDGPRMNQSSGSGDTAQISQTLTDFFQTENQNNWRIGNFDLIDGREMY